MTNKEALDNIIKSDYGYNFSQKFRDSVEVIRKAINDLELYRKAFEKACGHLEGYCETNDGKLVEIFEDDEFTRPSNREWENCLLKEARKELENEL